MLARSVIDLDPHYTAILKSESKRVPEQDSDGVMMMSNFHGSQKDIFVLWSDRFDETAATIFLTELRKAGLRTKLLSPARRRVAGAYGLALVPDLTLEQALSLITQVCCVVIPSSPVEVSRLRNDPRMTEFLTRASADNALIVIGEETGSAEPVVSWLFPADVRTYPRGCSLLDFARNLAKHLAGGQSPSYCSQPSVVPPTTMVSL